MSNPISLYVPKMSYVIAPKSRTQGSFSGLCSHSHVNQILGPSCLSLSIVILRSWVGFPFLCLTTWKAVQSRVPSTVGLVFRSGGLPWQRAKQYQSYTLNTLKRRDDRLGDIRVNSVAQHLFQRSPQPLYVVRRVILKLFPWNEQGKV